MTEASALKSVPYSVKKIKALVKERLIKTKEGNTKAILVSVNDIVKVVNMEKNLADNFLIVREFQTQLHISRTTKISALEQGLIDLSSYYPEDILQFRGKVYISKKWLSEFLVKYIFRSKMFDDFNLSISEYKQLKVYFGWEDIHLTKKTIFTPRKAYEQLDDFLTNHISVHDIREQTQLANRIIHESAKRQDIKPIKISTDQYYYPVSWVRSLSGNVQVNKVNRFVRAVDLETHPEYSKLLQRTKQTLKGLTRSGHVEYIIKDDNFMYVCTESLKRYFELEEDIINNYVDYYVFVETITGKKPETIKQYRTKIQQLIREGIIKGLELEIPFGGYGGNTSFVLKDSMYSFKERFVSLPELKEDREITYEEIETVAEKNNIELIRFTTKSKSHQFLLKEQIVPVIETYLNDKSTNYYTHREVYNLLNLTIHTFYTALEEENLSHEFSVGRVLFFSKTKVEELIRKQQFYRDNYYSNRDIKKMFGSYSPLLQNFLTKGTALMRAALNVKKVENFYDKQQVDEHYKKTMTKKQATTILDIAKTKKKRIKRYIEEQKYLSDYTSNSEIFKQLVNLHGLKFSDAAPFTEQEWYFYCIDKVDTMKGGNIHIKSSINRLVKLTEKISEFTIPKEFHNFSSNDINLAFFNENIPIRHQRLVHSFLKRLHAKLVLNGKNPVFKFERIINPFNYEVKKPVEKGIYEYQEYKDLLNYATNLSIHKEEAVKDVIATINKKSSPLYYASTWLYVLIHLNNAWRHSDVVFNIPRIDTTVLGIDNIEWFMTNDLTYEQATHVLNQVRGHEIIISKTQATGRFFCSEDLTLSFATAALLCELSSRHEEILIDGKEEKEHIIIFGNQAQKLPSYSHTAFFAKFEERPNFSFQSRKMNRSLLSYLYVLLVKKGQGGAALEVAQRLRAHEDFETTNIYIDIPEDEMNHLTRQLFQRGNFGYIPNLLAEVLLGQNQDREERTHDIIAIKNKMGSVLKLEATSGFINKIQSEKWLVAEKILSMGFEEARDLLFKLDANLLPAKEEGYQCLYGEDSCIRKGLKCRSCPFAIANFYTLSSLTKSIEEMLKGILNFAKTDLDGEKTRLANLLFTQLDKLDEAIEEFGYDEVIKFFDNEEEGYFKLLDNLDKINEDVEGYRKVLVSP